MKSEISNEYTQPTEIEYEVETIRNRKVINGEIYYLLKWKGYEEKYNTWEPVSNLNCPDLIKEYEKLKGNTNKRWRHHSIKKDQAIDIPEIKLINESKKYSSNTKKGKKIDNNKSVDLNIEKNDEIKIKDYSRSTNKTKILPKNNNELDNKSSKTTKVIDIDKIKNKEYNYSSEFIDFEIKKPIKQKLNENDYSFKNKKMKTYSSKDRKILDVDEKDIFKSSENNKKEKNEVIILKHDESEENKSFNKSIYKKIYYKKLYKKNNEVTNDPVILRRIKRNMKKWLDILKDSQYDKISIHNDIDLEGPPENFKYIKSCEYGKDVPRPEDITDFIIGCDCVGTCENDFFCSCSVRDNFDVPISFSYNKNGEVLITRSNIIHECNIKCFCGPDCPNRVIQKNDIKKLEIFKTKNKGWGVRAKEFIKKSTFVAEYTGEIIKTSCVSDRIKKDPERSHYIFDIDILGDPEYSIDAYEKGNISHFINHSCDPNLEVYCAQCDYYEMNIFRIAFFAKKDIQIDEELTFDYIGVDTPSGILKDEPVSINSPSSSSVSSTSSIVFTPPGEIIPYISHERTEERPKTNIIIDLSGDDNFSHSYYYNNDDNNSDFSDSKKSKSKSKSGNSSRSKSKSGNGKKGSSKSRSSSKSSRERSTKTKKEKEEEKKVFVVCHCGSANCRGFVYK